MKKNVFKIVIYLVLSSIAQAGNAEQPDKVNASNGECISRLSSDVKEINGLSDKATSINALQVLSSIYSHCAFHFQNKEIFYSYMQVADDIAIMSTHLELYFDGVAPLQYSEDKNKVINSLRKLMALKL